MKGFWTIACVVIAILAAGPACAEGTDLLGQVTGSYRIDSDRTDARFKVVQFGIATITGRFKRTRGTFTLSRNVAASRVDVTVDAASVTHLNKRVRKFMRGPELLDVEQFPDVRFRSRSVRRTGDDSAEINGELTIKSVTRPVTMTVRLAREGTGDRRLAFNATGTFKRSEFGLTAGLGLVSDDVDFIIDVVGARQ